MCSIATYCNVQTGTGWNPVRFLREAVMPKASTRATIRDDFEREPGWTMRGWRNGSAIEKLQDHIRVAKREIVDSLTG